MHGQKCSKRNIFQKAAVAAEHRDCTAPAVRRHLLCGIFPTKSDRLLGAGAEHEEGHQEDLWRHHPVALLHCDLDLPGQVCSPGLRPVTRLRLTTETDTVSNAGWTGQICLFLH